MIRPAALPDLPGIQKLFSFYEFSPIGEEILDDCAFVVEIEREILGFIWAGLMARGTVAYVDHFLIHPSLSRSGTGRNLCKTMVEELHARGCKIVLAHVLQDRFSFKSLKSCIGVGMQLDARPQFQLIGNVPNMIEVIANG